MLAPEITAFLLKRLFLLPDRIDRACVIAFRLFERGLGLFQLRA